MKAEKKSTSLTITFPEKEQSYPTYPYTRSGRVKRAPNLSEYEEDDTGYYYSTDESHYEERK